jgi:hypothetical protein
VLLEKDAKMTDEVVVNVRALLRGEVAIFVERVAAYARAPSAAGLASIGESVAMLAKLRAILKIYRELSEMSEEAVALWEGGGGSFSGGGASGGW